MCVMWEGHKPFYRLVKLTRGRQMSPWLTQKYALVKTQVKRALYDFTCYSTSQKKTFGRSRIRGKLVKLPKNGLKVKAPTKFGFSGPKRRMGALKAPQSIGRPPMRPDILGLFGHLSCISMWVVRVCYYAFFTDISLATQFHSLGFSPSISLLMSLL